MSFPSPLLRIVCVLVTSLVSHCLLSLPSPWPLLIRCHFQRLHRSPSLYTVPGAPINIRLPLLASHRQPHSFWTQPLILASLSLTVTLPIRSEISLPCQRHYSLGSKQIFCSHASQPSQNKATFIRQWGCSDSGSLGEAGMEKLMCTSVSRAGTCSSAAGSNSSPALGSRGVSLHRLALLYSHASRATPYIHRPGSCLWEQTPFLFPVPKAQGIPADPTGVCAWG